MKSKKKFVILDGFALIFRAFYAFINNPLKTSKGLSTSAIFGFVRMLIKLIKTYTPDYFVVALDSPTKTFRHDIYRDYKANRTDPPDDLKIQIPLIIDLLDKFKIASLRLDGYEADDIIGTLCERYKNEDYDVYVVSGDKDILQLVEGNIRVITTAKGISEVIVYDKEKVKDKWGVYPEKLNDLFALIGDSSDNIPGVKGIGPKGAVDLITSYNTVEGIYNNIDSINKAKVKENLINNKDNALLSKKLVLIERNVPIEFDIENFKNINIAQEEAINLLKEYELFSILKDEIFTGKLSSEITDDNIEISKKKLPVIPTEIIAHRDYYKPILTKDELETLVNKIIDSKLLSIDLETTSENPMIAEIIGVAFSMESKSGFYLPVDHQIKNELDKNVIFDYVKRICENVNIKKIGQNIKYDYIILKRYGIEIKSIVFDTMIASYVLDPGRRSHGMDYLAEELLNYKTIHYKDIVVKGNTLLDVDFSTVVQYASEDADITFRLYEKFKPMIDSSSFKDLYYNVELPLITVLARIELNGVNINPDYFRKMSKEIDERLKYLEKEIWELSDRVFNINSTKQLGEVLFIKLGLKPKKKTKTGFSTDVSVLEELAEEHQVPFLLLEYRKLVKLKTAYLDSIPKLINKNTNRVHTSFNQTITQTGRLSSNNPNLQNIPIKEEVGRAIRKGFIAQDKNYIMSADYSQIELRILAHVSQDSKLIKAYKEDLDIHVQTASLIFRKPESEINNDERRIAKTINFSVIYGIGARKLAKDLKISTKLAKDFIDHYFREYAGVINYIEKQKKLCFEQGFVETIFHRIRYIPEIKSSNNRDRSFGERLAVNTPIQGTSADLIKMAMVNIDKELQEKKLKSMMTIQVHDELVFEVPENELGIMKELVVRNMESVAKLSIPLKVSISYGLNWDEAH